VFTALLQSAGGFEHQTSVPDKVSRLKQFAILSTAAWLWRVAIDKKHYSGELCLRKLLLICMGLPGFRTIVYYPFLVTTHFTLTPE
jgi:hypothetical protein